MIYTRFVRLAYSGLLQKGYLHAAESPGKPQWEAKDLCQKTEEHALKAWRWISKGDGKVWSFFV